LTAGLKGDIQVWSITDAKLIKKLVKAHAFPITAIVSTKLCDSFISSDCIGNIKFWSLMEVHDDEKLTKSYLLDPDNIDMYHQFPKAHETGIFNMFITTDSKFAFSSDYNGNTKSWDIENRHMLVDFGKINNSILVSLEPKLAMGVEDKKRRQTDMGMYGRKSTSHLDDLL
jgi:WD40 repeat protein